MKKVLSFVVIFLVVFSTFSMFRNTAASGQLQLIGWHIDYAKMLDSNNDGTISGDELNLTIYLGTDSRWRVNITMRARGGSILNMTGFLQNFGDEAIWFEAPNIVFSVSLTEYEGYVTHEEVFYKINASGSFGPYEPPVLINPRVENVTVKEHLEVSGDCPETVTVNLLLHFEYTPWTPTPPTPDFSIMASPTSLTIQQGDSDTSMITITSINGFNQPVQPTVSGAPSGVTTTLSPEQVTPPPDGSTTSTLTVSADTTATPGSYTLTVTGTNGTLTHNVEIPLEITNPPPICSIKLQKEGIEIDEVDRTEFFDIYVGDSSDDTGIKEVCFSSDDVQDGVPTGEWTEWYNWSVSSEYGDWDETTKIKRWAFHTYGYKEVWAKVKDNAGQTANCSATIFVSAPALPVITSPLVITPVKDIYNVGDSLEAEFTIKNIGDVPITLDVLTVGGRLNGWCPDEGCPDFTFHSVTLQPYESYQYQGSFTPTQRGNYRFFIAYHINNPTKEEKTLLDENNWNTCVELGDGLTHTDRVKNIIVYEEGTVPEEVSMLKDKISQLKRQCASISYPPYLLDPDSFTSAVASVWTDFTSFITRMDLTQKYDELYLTGINYQHLRFQALIDADRFLESGNVEGAKRYLQKSYRNDKLSAMSFGAAAEVYDRNLEAGEILAEGIRNFCETVVSIGVTVVYPPAAHLVDVIYMGVDFAFNTAIEGVDQATMDLLIKTAAKIILINVEFPSLDSNTLEDYVNRVSTKVSLDTLVRNREFMEEFGRELREVVIEKFINEGLIELGEYGLEKLLEVAVDKLTSLIRAIKVEAKSPVELRVLDSKGQITGLINERVKHEIPMSLYYNGTITIYFPADSYKYTVAGIDEGVYSLEITSLERGNATIFNATDIPALTNTTHQYTIDWDALSVGEEGVTIQVDSNGDGVFEHTFASDSELTQSEFLAQTAPPPLSGSISPLSASILVGQSVTFTSTVSGGVTPYSYQWYLNGNPVSGATSDTWTFTPTTSGIYYVYPKVTDDTGNTTQSETARITVTTVPVGGYGVPIQLPTIAKPATLHIALLTILAAIFITIKRKTKRKH